MTMPGVDYYTGPGPCEPWPVRWPGSCDISTVSPEITGIAVQAASELLYQLTAQRFGLCRVALRPCREECFGNGFGWGFRAGWWGDVGYPTPYWSNGQWYNLGCGQCGSSCSCTAMSEVYLPGPVNAIVEVIEHGVILTPDVDYRLDDYRKLVRLGGVWPFCNDLNQPVTGTGTYTVVADFGENVPILGQLAMGEVACDLINFLLGEDCKLPAGITDLTRQGVSMSFADVDNGLTTFFAKFPISYLFVKTYNPHQLMARARAYDIDGPDFRITGT